MKISYFRDATFQGTLIAFGPETERRHILLNFATCAYSLQSKEVGSLPDCVVQVK